MQRDQTPNIAKSKRLSQLFEQVALRGAAPMGSIFLLTAVEADKRKPQAKLNACDLQLAI